MVLKGFYMTNLELLLKMFPGQLVIDAKDALKLANKGYSTWAAAVGANEIGKNLDLAKFPPFYDANQGKKKHAKWEINLVDLAKWLDSKALNEKGQDNVVA
jgi:hypothetical protein